MENKPEFSISLSDGKYTYQRLEQAGQRLLRYGKPWAAADAKIIGDNVLLAFGYAAEDLQTRVSRLGAFIQYMFDDAARSAARWEAGPSGPLGEQLRVRAQAVKGVTDRWKQEFERYQEAEPSFTIPKKRITGMGFFAAVGSAVAASEKIDADPTTLGLAICSNPPSAKTRLVGFDPALGAGYSPSLAPSCGKDPYDISGLEPTVSCLAERAVVEAQKTPPGTDAYASVASLLFGFPVTKHSHPAHRDIAKRIVLLQGYTPPQADNEQGDEGENA